MAGLISRWSLINWFRSGDQTQEDESQDVISRQMEQEDAALAVHDSQASRQDQAVEQLQGAYEQVVGLMNSIQGHMSAQSDRSERLLQMMEGLPEALRTLPESQRNQAQMLEAIKGHLAQQSKNSEGLTQAIQGLAHAADNHERSMNLIQQQLDANQESGQQVLSSFNSLSQTLGRMSESSQAGTHVLERLAERHEQADIQMRDLFGRNQRQMTVMSVVSWALAIAALAVASVVAVWVGQKLAGTEISAAAPTIQAAPATPVAAQAPVGADQPAQAAATTGIAGDQDAAPATPEAAQAPVGADQPAQAAATTGIAGDQDAAPATPEADTAAAPAADEPAPGALSEAWQPDEASDRMIRELLTSHLPGTLSLSGLIGEQASATAAPPATEAVPDQTDQTGDRPVQVANQSD